MAIPSLPAQGSTSWYSYMQWLDSHNKLTVINAADYGVIPGATGITDALNNLTQANPGKVIYLPEGTYDFTTTIRMYGPLLGAGWGTNLRFPELSYACVWSSNVDSISYRNFLITSTSARTGIDTSSSHALMIDGSTGFEVSGVAVTGLVRMGIHIRNAHRGVVRSNRIYGTAFDGIHLTNGTTDVDVTGNHMVNTGDDGIALISYNTDAARNERIAVVGNTVYNGSTRGITCEGGKTISIAGNSIDTTATFSILINSIGTSTSDTWASDGVTVTGNTLRGSGSNGIRVDGNNTRVVLVGNNIVSPAGTGIYVTVGSVLVNGNNIDSAGGNGIQLMANALTAGAVVSNNRIVKPSAQAIYSEASNTTYRDNSIYLPSQGGTQYPGITVYNASNIVATGNRIDAIDSAHTNFGVFFDHVTGGLVALTYVTGGATATGSNVSTGILTA